jgi:predicted small integral membrane protein
VWQSNVCNGQQKAFMIYLTMLAVLIFVVERDGDLRKG